MLNGILSAFRGPLDKTCHEHMRPRPRCILRKSIWLPVCLVATSITCGSDPLRSMGPHTSLILIDAVIL